MKKEKIQAPKGVSEYVPPQSREFEWVRDGLIAPARLAGYALMELPVFEDTQLFTRGVGESTDVVSKEMYTFEDRGGRSITLRPEGTAGVMRAVIEHNLDRAQLPIKVWYSGAFFRAERPQAGRYRQFYQVGIEAIGLNDPENKPKRSKEQAKREADSLLVLIKSKKAIFDTLVKTISDDMGSKTNGGDYGWFDENKGFVTPFKNAGLKGTIGNISVVETQFGYHIIEVLNVSKTRHTNYTIAQIFKLIAPSDETNQAIYAKANQFGGENNTGELFDKAVATQKLTKQMADNIKEGDRQLPGLDQAKELTNWVYTAEKGDVNIFSFNDKHIVAKLSGIKNKGVLPLEDVKEEVTLKAIKQKKSNLFLEEFKNKGNGKNIQEIATKLKLELNKQETLMPESRVVDLLGIDDIFIGTVLGTKVNAISKASVSNNGVFIVKVSAIKTNPNNDFKETKNQLEQLISGRADNDVFEGLKEMSDIEDHKSRIE